ncbi:MAG: type II toxin-antitoxin system Phd/YefM family antitoxin [Symploca sp. SIO2G7]|nr:type II toxin-antitoxin system Phd/YefM family antitoxin [Symploca sp. SIO2G7]
MISLNIDDIQQNLSGFIKLIQEGNRLIITQADQPIAEIKPISKNRSQQEPRPIGLCEGEFIVPDDFNDPLPEEIINLFVNP